MKLTELSTEQLVVEVQDRQPVELNRELGNVKFKAELVVTLRQLMRSRKESPETHEFVDIIADERQVASAGVLESFACPICLETALPPIYQCANGHVICHSCEPDVDNCPICRSTNLEGRALMGEKWLETLWLPCAYDSCPELVRCGQKTAHVTQCPFKLVPLVVVDATELNYLSDFIKGQTVEYRNCRYYPITVHQTWKHNTLMMIIDKFGIDPWNPDDPSECRISIKFFGWHIRGHKVKITVQMWMRDGTVERFSLVDPRNVIKKWWPRELPEAAKFRVTLENI